MLILGIESSCDDTAAAVLAEGRRILSNVVSSQVAIHQPYGGVVPELASRQHLQVIIPVVATALDRARVELRDLDAIAVTQGPGLVGSLLVGIGVAKALALAAKKPLLAVNHLQAHIHAALLEGPPAAYPLVALVVSGGHTNLYLIQEPGQFLLVGRTRDDAAGEAFDKVAKLLGLGYPGGVVIDRLAAEGNPQAIAFPRALLEKDSLDFSFSGIKTAVVNYVRRHHLEEATAQAANGGQPLRSSPVADIVASFQEAVVDVLASKVQLAAARHQAREIVVAGGVAANSRLRQRLTEVAVDLGIALRMPPPELCTDNGVMIAAAGHQMIARGSQGADFDFDAVSRWPDLGDNHGVGSG